MVLYLALIVIGAVLLAPASDQFVTGASRIAVAKRISPVVVGAVIIGFGTSAPELLTSVLAALNGNLDIATGNVIGSNLANLSLVLGIAALMTPILVKKTTLKREVPLALAATIAFAIAVQNGLTRIEGVVLLLLMVASLIVIIRGGSKNVDEGQVDSGVDTADAPSASLGKDVLRVVLGLIAVVAGAQLLVMGAQGITTELGISGGFVGLTLVALGTSLPEIVTGVAAARKGETELLIGNLLGSNMFNALAVGGLAAVVGPGLLTDSGLTVVAAGVMVAVALLATIILATGKRVTRAEGVLLLVLYFGSLPFMV